MNTQMNEKMLASLAIPNHGMTTAEHVPAQPITVPDRPLTLPEEDDETGDNNFASPEIGAMHDRQEALEINRRELERIARSAELANRD